MNREPGLNHAAIGDGRTVALVRPGGTIDWLCMPRFDSPSVFAGLLDPERGGHFSILPAAERYEVRSAYTRNTNVVRHHVETSDGVYELIDFMPRYASGDEISAPLEVHRLLVPLAGRPRIRIDFEPRPDYARIKPRLLHHDRGVVVEGDCVPYFLTGDIASDVILQKRDFALDRPCSLVFSYGRPAPRGTHYVQAAWARTERTWRRWVKRCALPGIAAEHVIRSALVLRLFVYDATGAIVAAATTSIPEERGTGRTWDYRYCWMRDAWFVVTALRTLGQLEEAEGFGRFIQDLLGPGRPQLQPLYGVAGETELPEVILDSLRGFDGKGPVRIGNAAAKHLQTDVFGEACASLVDLALDPRVDAINPEQLRADIPRLVEQALSYEGKPDAGIWEFRTFLNIHTFSQAMIWVAVNKGVQWAEAVGEHDLAKTWKARADALRERILRDGYNGSLGMFTQAFNGRFPDATSLLLPSLGLIRGTDPRMESTLVQYERLLSQGGLMRRYINQDDFGVSGSAFTICSFWWVQALARAGRVGEARALFDRLLCYANDFGLFSEDLDPHTGEPLGNFPQAYTHVGVILAAFDVARALGKEPM